MSPMLQVLCFTFVISSVQSLAIPKTTFLGSGYNIVQGNPEGGSIKHGGLDPGLRPSMQILEVTYGDSSTNSCPHEACPNEATCARLAASSTLRRLDFVDDMFKYRSEYQKSLTTGGSMELMTAFLIPTPMNNKIKLMVEASSSLIAANTNTYYEVKNMMESKQDVLITEQTWNIHSDVTYDYLSNKRLTQEFRTHLCQLSPSSDFKHFFEKWGTHVILQARLGSKRFKRKVFSKTEYFRHVHEFYSDIIKFERSFSVLVASVSSLDSTHISSAIGKSLASTKVKYDENEVVTGSSDTPVPLSLNLIDIPSLLTSDYFNITDSCSTSRNDLENLQVILQAALVKYIQNNSKPLNRVTRSVKLEWPSGTYSLLQTKYGCPPNWETGYRCQDSEDNNNSNDWSPHLITWYLKSHHLGKDYICLHFCSKTNTMSFPDIFVWSAGSYCIFKKYNCPSGFSQSTVKIDDEDSSNNNEKPSGMLPAGVYGRDTQFELCCRNDGDPNSPIIMPTNKHFILLRVLDKCQNVRGMESTELYLKWDSEDVGDGSLTNVTGYVKPKHELSKYRDLTLYFCYCNSIL